MFFSHTFWQILHSTGGFVYNVPLPVLWLVSRLYSQTMSNQWTCHYDVLITASLEVGSTGTQVTSEKKKYKLFFYSPQVIPLCPWGSTERFCREVPPYRVWGFPTEELFLFKPECTLVLPGHFLFIHLYLWNSCLICFWTIYYKCVCI